MDSQKERRQFAAPRVSAELKVIFRDFPNQKYLSTNISQSGILVLADHHWEPEEFVKFEVEIPPGNIRIPFVGRIARLFEAETKKHVAIQIIELEAEDRKVWLEYLSKIEELALEERTTSSTRLLLEDANQQIRYKKCFVFRFKLESEFRDYLQKAQQTGGIYIETSMTKTIGDNLEILFESPTTKKILTLNSTIVRPNEMDGVPNGHFGLAAKFTDQKELVSNAIKQFLQGSSESELERDSSTPSTD